MQTTITSQDPWQPGYAYVLTSPTGSDFHPDFKPELTPQQMLELGVFCGDYLVETSEYPSEWFTRAKVRQGEPDATLNYFKIAASQPHAVWVAKGWIHPEDPRGWFQWYCRYYLGRRSPQEDARQIKRWKAMTRHIAQVKKNCRTGDILCRPKQRQALLQWAYDSRTM
ncbi:hypothetical protein BH11PAT4_BH11PAT4_6590 [soil metagenome]